MFDRVQGIDKPKTYYDFLCAQVGVKADSVAIAQLYKLLASGGYNMIRQFMDHVWVDKEIHWVEMKIVCETRGLEHALELKRMIEKAYPTTTVFETEPFNDKRMCPCYVKK
ncbi:unnamed protein product [Parnassius apollo]|uniref:(apollo) hypothetical protein n=1 Tax=Parnassius apollo TaxID=110799 RepID=A0A8S3WEH3_PARAO|nr:unnamed protein product [Parnassius apollo]